MIKISISILLLLITHFAKAQNSKPELYDLIKKIWMDSTGYSSVGDWAVGNSKKYPVKWKEDRIIMSDDTTINFYRLGSIDIVINGRSFLLNNQPVKWQIMLKGPRMGFSSFSIISTASKELKGKYVLDSLFHKKDFTAILIKSRADKELTGYYYYKVKMPGKDLIFIKISWVSANGNSMIRIDGYDDWSKYAVKLECKN
ncbi:MAG TPA: hypothetical protein PKU77_09180 [Ferruginibacter sp.]|nr:hypothetical protein [Ferruginibacter sp.]